MNAPFPEIFEIWKLGNPVFSIFHEVFVQKSQSRSTGGLFSVFCFQLWVEIKPRSQGLLRFQDGGWAS